MTVTSVTPMGRASHGESSRPNKLVKVDFERLACNWSQAFCVSLSCSLPLSQEGGVPGSRAGLCGMVEAMGNGRIPFF